MSELDPLDPFDAASPELDPPELDPDVGSPELDPPDVGSPELDAGALSPPLDGPLDLFFADAAEDRRSFLAQPLPLKWIVGGANARLTRPSQSGHW